MARRAKIIANYPLIPLEELLDMTQEQQEAYQDELEEASGTPEHLRGRLRDPEGMQRMLDLFKRIQRQKMH